MLKNLGYSSKEEYISFLRKLYISKLEVNRKFPELINNDNLKTDVLFAAQKVIEKIKPNHTAEDCWLYFVAALSACTQGCSYSNNWEQCIDDCYAVVVGTSSICFLFAE